MILFQFKIKSRINEAVKIVSNKKNEVMYVQEQIFYEFKSKVTHFKKHLSIVSFKPESLISFGKAKRSELEKSEDIELIRALDIGMKIKTINLTGDSFSIDVFEDYTKSQSQIKKDRYLKFYR